MKCFYLFIYLLPDKQLHRSFMFGFHSILLHVSTVNISRQQALVYNKSTRGPALNRALPFYNSCAPKPYLMTAVLDIQ